MGGYKCRNNRIVKHLYMLQLVQGPLYSSNILVLFRFLDFFLGSLHGISDTIKITFYFRFKIIDGNFELIAKISRE